MPLTPEWASFFAAELGALASLTGFVVVAISINLARILSYPHLPTRAGEALIGAIAATSVLLIPEQSSSSVSQALVEDPPGRDGLAGWASIERFCQDDRQLPADRRDRIGNVAFRTDWGRASIENGGERASFSRRQRAEGGKADLSRIRNA